MNMKHLVPICLAISVLAYSCNENQCPTDYTLAEVNLMPNSDQAMPNIAQKKMIYIDSVGNELTVNVENIQPTRANREIAIECVEPRLASTTPNMTTVFLNSEDIRLKANSEDNAYSFEYIITTGYANDFLENAPADTSERILYDGLYLFFNAPATFIHRSNTVQVVSDRGNNLTSIDSNFEYINDTTLLNKPFQDVYTEVFSDRIFFTPTQGVVAFKDTNDTLWVLDRIE